jgi:hypothetical protein
VSATLVLNRAEREHADHTVTLSLLDALVTILATNCQPAAGKVVGDESFAHKNFVWAEGGAHIPNPRAGRYPCGSVLEDCVSRELAEIELTAKSSDLLTVSVVVVSQHIHVKTVRKASRAGSESPNSDAVLKAVVFGSRVLSVIDPGGD